MKVHGMRGSRGHAAITVFMITMITGCTSEMCPPGSYYDTAVARCEMCHSICENADTQGTMTECRRFCPDYKVQMQSRISPKNSATVPKDMRQFDANPEDNDDHHILLIPILLGVCVFICVVIGISVIYLRDRQAKHGNRRFYIPETVYLKVDRNQVKGPHLPSEPPKYQSPQSSLI